jgi:methionyl-tRNA formyltransferase
VKFGFVTCVQLGLTCMEAIDAAGGSLEVVVTLRDDLAVKKSGRVYVDDFCASRRIDLVKVNNINDDDAVATVRRHGLDWLFVIGWSQIGRAPILAAPERGVIGMHPTLLPVGRGRAAIPWAILKDLRETGVTMFTLDQGVDTGPIIAQEHLPLAPDETATSLYERIRRAHAKLMRDVWPALVADQVILTPQDDSRATEWPGRRPEDGLIRPEMKVADAERLVRATTHPYPGAFWRDATGTLRIWRAVVGRERDMPRKAARIRLSDGVLDAVDFAWES